MIEIILCMLVWCWELTPLWFNIVTTVLLVLRFGWRCMLSVLKILEINKNRSKKLKGGDEINTYDELKQFLKKNR